MPAVGPTLSIPENSAAHLHCAPDASLTDPRVHDTVIAAAHGIAERTGVTIREIAVTAPTELTVTVAGAKLVAVGLVAELRRDTDRWHRARTGRPLWTGPDREEAW